MNLISDLLLSSGAFGAAIYCYVLSARLKKLTALESGMGGAIAVLSMQVDDMTKALNKAGGAATGSAASLEGLTTKADAAATRIELLLAAMYDLPDPAHLPQVDAAGAEDVGPKRRFVRRRTARAEMEMAREHG
jgi:hypothetical protein